MWDYGDYGSKRKVAKNSNFLAAKDPFRDLRLQGLQVVERKVAENANFLDTAGSLKIWDYKGQQEQWERLTKTQTFSLLQAQSQISILLGNIEQYAEQGRQLF